MTRYSGFLAFFVEIFALFAVNKAEIDRKER